MLPALTVRAVRTLLRQPALALSPLMTSLFFLLIYAGQLGDAGDQMLGGLPYLDFILPLILLTVAFTGGAVAGQLLVRDMTSGYHRRLALTRAGSGRIVAAPLSAAALVLALQSCVVVGAGWGLGMRGPGAAQVVALILGTTTAGVGFSLFGAAAAIWSGTDAAVNGTVLVFFPLSFVTSAFAPRQDLAGWMAVGARFNPLTYLLEGLRSAGGGVAPAGAPLAGAVVLGALLVLGAVACGIAFRLVRRTQ